MMNSVEGLHRVGSPSPGRKRAWPGIGREERKRRTEVPEGDMSFGMAALRKGKCGMVDILMMVFHCSNRVQDEGVIHSGRIY